MLSRTLALGMVLVAIQPVSAEDTSASGDPANQQRAYARPAQEPSHSLDDVSSTPVSDRLPTAATREKQQHLLQQKCKELDRLQREVEQLREATGTPQQIFVRVQLLEVSLTKLRNLGVDLDFLINGNVSGLEARQSVDVDSVRAITRTAEPATKKESGDILNVVESLKRDHLAKGLGDSRLAVVGGRPASMNIGGEIPVPVSNNSKAAVDFLEYGTGIDLQALALGDNQVRLEVTTNVRRIVPGRETKVNGVRVPGFDVHRCKNVSELSFGQTTVLTGLVERRVEGELRNGKLNEEVNEVQLMVVVTPELAPALDVPTASANRDINGATRK